MKRGKKYVEAAKLVDRATLYDVNEAVSIVKKASSAKFDETVEAHIRTGCDGRHADQQIRGAVVLPHGTGKNVRVLVFAKNDKADIAKLFGDVEFITRDAQPADELAFITPALKEKETDEKLASLGSKVLGKIRVLDM